MKVLHLYANYKWTGAAELALLLVRGEMGSALLDGTPIESRLALSGFAHAGMEHAIARRAEALGLPTLEGLSLRRHFHLPALCSDAVRLAGWIDWGRVDLLHCHQGGDHFLAALAASFASRKIPLVRSFWEDEAPLPFPRSRFAFERTSALILPFASQLPRFLARFALPAGRVLHLPPPLDPAEARVADREACRNRLEEEIGAAPGTPLLGITARIQKQRRWELLWEILAAIHVLRPGVRLLVLGRPDEGRFRELCEAPLRALGLEGAVHFLGYRRGRDYWESLAGLDLFLFLVPGTDATCRALRQAMALGLPVLCSDLGRLPEIVRDGETGWIREPRAEAFSRAAVRLLDRRDLRSELGRRAQEHASREWRMELPARRELYSRLCGEEPG